MRKQIISLLLAISMCGIMFPINAYAVASDDYTQWKQYDAEWNQQEAWTKEEFPNATMTYMSQCGCLVTTIAMLLRHYNVVPSSDLATFNPWICNEELKAADAFDCAADLYFGRVENAYPGMKYLGCVGYSLATVKELFNAGYACIVKVNGSSGLYHFVAVKAINGDTVSIMDPGSNATSLSAYGTKYEIFYYEMTPGCTHTYGNVGICTLCQTEYDFGASFETDCAGIYTVSLKSGIYLRTDRPYSASEAKTELIKKGETVRVLGSVKNHYQKLWYKVSYNGVVGYTSADNLTLVPHDCDKGTYKYSEETHPHRNCYECSRCGKVWVDNGSNNFVSSCTMCVKNTNLPTDVFLSQQTGVTCTLSAAAMMLRSNMYLNETPRWAEVTESAIRPVAWVENVGLKFNFNHSVGNTSLSVGHEFVSGLSVQSLKNLLDSHPEGVVIYCGYAPHAVFLFDHDGDTFYCADPAGSYSGKRIKLADSLLGYYYGDQSTILGNVTAYWYISAVAVDGVVVPGKPVLNHSISNNTVTFTWNGTYNTTHYNLWLDKKNAEGEWECVEQIFYAENGVSRELPDGEYRAQLLSYNSNAYESDGSDWVHTWADDVFFSIDTEKKVTYYGADGNVWLEDGFASGENYVLATQYPTGSNGYFSGWAYASNATEWDVRPGDTINCTEDVSLHPVYVSHTDAISGNAVQIYNIADFTQSGYNIETVQVTVQREETVGSWSAWSDYTTDEITPSDSVQVETTTLYRYYYFYCSNCGGREPFWGTSDCGAQIPNTAWHIGWFTTPFSQCNHETYSYTSAKYYTTSLGDDQIWNFSSGNLNDTAVGTKDSGGTEVVITTGYRSRTYVEQSETVEKTVTAYKITKTANTNTRYEVLYYPSKTDYWVGESVDITGLSLKVFYEDGSTAVITDGFAVSGFDSETIGTKTILISYDGFTVAFDITVTYGGVCGM